MSYGAITTAELKMIIWASDARSAKLLLKLGQRVRGFRVTKWYMGAEEPTCVVAEHLPAGSLTLMS